MLFNNNVRFGRKLCLDPDEREMKHIPQFYRGDADYVYRLGGPVMRSFLDAIPLSKGFKYISIDSRVHMLKPSWMACIGGWHCDDFYRPSGEQPDLKAIVRDEKYSMHHAMVLGLLPGSEKQVIAPTEFIVDSFEMDVPEDLHGKTMYAHFDKSLNSMLSSHPLNYGNRRSAGSPFLATQLAEHAQIISFDCFDFHRGTPSEHSGWRLFVRATESNHYAPQNEIRTQTQVYLESFHAGW